MSTFYDTYFINPKRALKFAKQKNKVKLYNGFGTQICYYSGEKVDNTPENMIYLAMEDIKSFFLNKNYRLPEYIDFNNSIYKDNDEMQVTYKNVILNIFKEMAESEQRANEQLLIKIKDININLNKNNINFMIIVSRSLTYDYFYSKKLSKSLKKLGHDVHILTEYGSKKVLIDHLKTSFVLKNILKIKPDVAILINDHKTSIFPDNTYQISILNNFTLLLNSIHRNDIRARDIILTENYSVEKFLNKKEIQTQYIPPTVTIKISKQLQAKKNNTFCIFSSYFDLDDYIVFKEMVKKLFIKINTEVLNINKIKKHLNQTNYTNKNDNEMMIFLLNNIILQSCIKWIDSDTTKVNLIGKNWNRCKSVPQNVTIKDEVDSIEVDKKIKYMLHISPNIINTNLLEILKRNTIPIVYDLRKEDKRYDSVFDDYCLFFKNKEELNYILNHQIEPQKKDVKKLLTNYSFDSLSKNIETIILNHQELF